MNVRKDSCGISLTSIRSTTALEGPFLHHALNRISASSGPDAIIRTVPSSSFRTDPVIPERMASSRVLCLKNTPWTLPYTVMEIVFSMKSIQQPEYVFKIFLVGFIKFVICGTVNVQHSPDLLVFQEGDHDLGAG